MNLLLKYIIYTLYEIKLFSLDTLINRLHFMYFILYNNCILQVQIQFRKAR